MAKRLVDGLTDRFQSKSKRQALGFWSSFPASFADGMHFLSAVGVRAFEKPRRIGRSELGNSARGNSRFGTAANLRTYQAQIGGLSLPQFVPLSVQGSFGGLKLV